MKADKQEALARTVGSPLGWPLLVAVLALQFVQGMLGAFYLPLLTPIARNVGMRDADWNLFDSGIAAVAALALPVLSWLGDRFGHRRLIIISVVLVAASTWLVVLSTNFVSLFVAFALSGLSAVWVPFSMALARTRIAPGEVDARLNRLSAAIVAAFMIGSVLATVAGGQLFTRTGGWNALQRGLAAGLAPDAIHGFRRDLVIVLSIPAVFATAALPFALLLPREHRAGAKHEPGAFLGLFCVGVVMLGIVLGFGLVKMGGAMAWAGWAGVAASVLACGGVLKWQARSATPAVDVPALRSRSTGPFFLALILFTVCHTAASVPLVTFVLTDRHANGYGMSASPADVSLLMLSMILVIIAVSIAFGRLRSSRTRLVIMRLAPLAIAVEYGWFILFHEAIWQGVMAAVLGGLGAGVLNVGITAMIAAGAPVGHTARQLGLSNAVSIAGGTVGSAVFAIALHDTASSTAAPLSGYFTVWSIAIASALATSVILCFAREPTVNIAQAAEPSAECDGGSSSSTILAS